MKLLDARRKKQQIICIWRYIDNGFIETCAPIRVTRAGTGKIIRLPVPRTEQFKKSVLMLAGMV